MFKLLKLEILNNLKNRFIVINQLYAYLQEVLTLRTVEIGVLIVKELKKLFQKV